MWRIRSLFGVVIVVISVIEAKPAAAQEAAAGFALDRFEPSERGGGWFVLDRLDFRGHGRLGVGITGDWAYRPLATFDANNSIVRSIVKNQMVGHAGLSLNLSDMLRLGLSVPVQFWANGSGGTIGTAFYPGPAHSQSLGDLRLSADVRLLGVTTDPVTVALGASVHLPTGDKQSYASDGDVRIAPHAIVAGEVDAFVYSARAGLLYRAQDTNYAGTPIGSELQFGAAAGIQVLERRLLIGPEFYGLTVVDGGGRDGFFKKRSTPAELLMGIHYYVTDEWQIGAGVAAGLSRGYGTPTTRGVLNLTWMSAPAKPPPPVEPRPPAPPDADDDGIPDSVDACIDLPGVSSTDPKKHGCPLDRDGDRIWDEVDACPDVPGTKSGDAKRNGCPPDRDGDGVFDAKDACPDEVGPETNDPKTNGCPDRDRDKDGIANDVDACPDEAGKSDPDPKKNGCPKAFVRDNQIVITDQVKFVTGSAAIQAGKDSEDVLNAVLTILKSHPEIHRVRVEGHTDSRGRPAQNKKLSADRAASVVRWLTKHGIDKSVLISQGFGPDRPLRPNDTEEGRRENRRVEFHIVEDAK